MRLIIKHYYTNVIYKASTKRGERNHRGRQKNSLLKKIPPKAQNTDLFIHIPHYSSTHPPVIHSPHPDPFLQVSNPSCRRRHTAIDDLLTSCVHQWSSVSLPLSGTLAAAGGSLPPATYFLSHELRRRRHQSPPVDLLPRRLGFTAPRLLPL